MIVLQRLRATLVAGLFLLVPLTVVIAIALKVMAFTRPITERIASLLGMTVGVRFLEVAALIVICLLAGLVMRWSRVGSFSNWLERNVLSLLPGYEYLRMRMDDMLSGDERAVEHAVLVRFDDNTCPGRLMEEGPDGTCVVFIPDTPQTNSGAVVIVGNDRVEHLDIPYDRLVSSVRNYGKGLLAIKAKARS
jgi:uncharacterized membrane protein